MSTIWKFELEITDEQVIQMPRGAQILSVQMQRDKICLWAIVNPEKSQVAWRVTIYGTGHPCHHGLKTYLGTVQTHAGQLVWHVFAEQV